MDSLKRQLIEVAAAASDAEHPDVEQFCLLMVRLIETTDPPTRRKLLNLFSELVTLVQRPRPVQFRLMDGRRRA